MTRIVLADDGFAFDGEIAAIRDHAAACFVALAESLAARGHKVEARTRGTRRFDLNGVSWGPIERIVPKETELYIVNGSYRLLRLARKVRRTVLWVHEPGRKMLRWGRLTALARRRPYLVFQGVYHAATYPRWAPGGGRAIIPPTTGAVFRTSGPALRPPPPFAIFTARSPRSLDWVLDIWQRHIRPSVPKAQLYVFADAMPDVVLEKARRLAGDGVVLREPVAGEALVEELRQSRVYLHRGDESEVFGMAVAEAQAMGVPAVACDVTCMRERIVHGETGYVVRDGDAAAFAGAAMRILTDDTVWRDQRDAALRYNRARSWDDVAADFEELRK